MEPTSIDYFLALVLGIPAILEVLLGTEEGRELTGLILRQLPDLLCTKFLTGYDVLKERFHLVLLERGIHNMDELWAYIQKDPVANTLDLLVTYLSDPETLTALVQAGLSAASWAVIFLTALLILATAAPFLAVVLPMLIKVLAVILIVQLAIDFLKEHWETIQALVGQAVEYVREKISEMVSAMRLAIRTGVNKAITSLFFQAKELAESIGLATKTLLDSLQVLAQLMNKATEEAFRLFHPLLYTLIRTVSRYAREPVTIDMIRLSHAVDQMDRLAARVGTIDRRLDSLYGKLCQKSIEQGEGIFTSIANLYHLSSADIRVDQGHSIRRKANALRELFDGYSDCEHWLAEAIGG